MIGAHGNWVHDLEVADFDGDGLPDVLTHGNGTHIWYQNAPDNWTERDLSSSDKTKEGIGIGDIDNDGRIDFVQGGWWFKNPGTRMDNWTTFRFASGYDGGSFTAVIGDLNGDGRPDIVVSEQHKRHPLAWYVAPADPRQGDWARQVVADDMGAHKLNLADMNGDGRIDLVVGLELAEMRLYLNDGSAAPVFTSHVIQTKGCHNTRVADINGDGSADILCANYIGHPPLEVWLNQRLDPLSLEKWHHIRVDAAREKMGSGLPAFGLAFGDIDRDGQVDIVSGRYFYRNPGGDLTGPWQRSAFPVDADAMLVLDVDGDGQLDAIAQALPNVYWLKPNANGSQWTAQIVARLTPTEHGNAQGYRLARILPGSARSDIVFTTGDGVWMLRIPDDSAAGHWPSFKIASGTTEDLLAVGDVDGDGRIDFVASGASNGRTVDWYRNPGRADRLWERYPVGDVVGWGDRSEVVDIDGDGRPDIVVSTENGASTGAATYWFKAPRDPRTQPWTRHELASKARPIR